MRPRLCLCAALTFCAAIFHPLVADAVCIGTNPPDDYTNLCYAPLAWFFANDNVEAYVGTDPNWYNTQWIGWHNLRTDECSWDQIGDSNGFTDDITIQGGYGNDYSGPVYGSGITFCGYYIDPPIYGGHDLYYDMASYSGGTDYIYNDDNPSNMYGNSDYGNEFYSSTVNVNMLGGTSTDTFWVDGTGLLPGYIYTYDGDDNIYLEQYNSWTYPSGTNALNVSCGGGGDSYCGPGTKPTDCEYVGFFCGGEGP